MNKITTLEINIFKTFFRGREDVFAIRWEKGNKSGYMPAYFYDPYLYQAHKIHGGTFKTYTDKTYLPLSEVEIKRHLEGEQFIGVYPLLPNNTSWFIAADFDEADWSKDAQAFIRVCAENGIPAYLERSRSGNGGHVWIFFEEPYPATKSRSIAIALLEEARIFSVFDKESSFDRLFPNQDYLSGKGLGNLIALPLNGKAIESGNSCFLDPESLVLFPDLWQFLESIKRTPVSILNTLLEQMGQQYSALQHSIATTLEIKLANEITINRNAISGNLIKFLKEELNFANSEFIIKTKIGKSTYGTERYFKLVTESQNEAHIPRGFIGRLIRFCRENKIEHELLDKRKKLPTMLFQFNAQLKEHQITAIRQIEKKEFGVVVAPPGSGKTVLGLKLIAERQQPALILVHRKQLLLQWMERIEAFLGIPKNEIGVIGQGKKKPGKKVTVGTIQSIAKELENTDSLFSNYGTIIIDECHHVPAESFRKVLSKLHTYYLYGLTATPFRKYNDGKLIFTYLGEVIFELKAESLSSESQARIIVRNTELDIPFNSKTDEFEVISKVLIHDSARNKLILDDVKHELNKGRKAVVITERIEHIYSLHQYLKQSFEVITLSGDDSDSSKAAKWKQLKSGNFQALITTGQYFGEGSDLTSINSLFLVYPFSFQGKLIQYIGRVQRSEITPTIYDYRDSKIDYLNKLFLKRNTYYRKIQKTATLFDEPESETESTEDNKSMTVESKIKVPIEQLEFHYGAVAFPVQLNEPKIELTFEIENQNVRPEFEVLKPYFEKFLNSKTVNIEIQAEFENEQLVSQLATSTDIDKINREVVDGVKFRFIQSSIIGRIPEQNKDNLLTISDIQSASALYGDGSDLLTDILSGKEYVHSKHLQYLAQNHLGTYLKIRFVLSPFSFVFLLSGDKHFHVVLETLDTREATYIWHCNKSKEALVESVKRIESDLSIIRNKGRQVFLETNPENFSKIQHDYSDERKGFVVWKDQLEERLT